MNRQTFSNLLLYNLSSSPSLMRRVHATLKVTVGWLVGQSIGRSITLYFLVILLLLLLWVSVSVSVSLFLAAISTSLADKCGQNLKNFWPRDVYSTISKKQLKQRNHFRSYDIAYDISYYKYKIELSNANTLFFLYKDQEKKFYP